MCKILLNSKRGQTSMLISYTMKEALSNFLFSHYKSIETISCHSNQSSYPTGIKNTTFVEGNVLCKLPKFSFILLTVSEKKTFEYFSKIYPLCRPVNQLN